MSISTVPLCLITFGERSRPAVQLAQGLLIAARASPGAKRDERIHLQIRMELLMIGEKLGEFIHAGARMEAFWYSVVGDTVRVDQASGVHSS